jgi:hypothetical protein
MPSSRAASILSPLTCANAFRIVCFFQFGDRNDTVGRLAHAHQFDGSAVDLGGKIAHLNFICAAQGAGSFQRVFQFADIARPVIAQQSFECLVRNTFS